MSKRRTTPSALMLHDTPSQPDTLRPGGPRSRLRVWLRLVSISRWRRTEGRGGRHLPRGHRGGLKALCPSGGLLARVRAPGRDRAPFRDALFDVIVSFETIEHVTDYRVYLAEVRRVLKDEGLFICSTPNRWYGPKDVVSPFHVLEFSPEDLRKALEPTFRDLALYGQGVYGRAEKLQMRLTFAAKRVVQPLRARAPKVYEWLRALFRLYRNVATFRSPRVRLDNISDVNEIVDEAAFPYPLCPSWTTSSESSPQRRGPLRSTTVFAPPDCSAPWRSA